MDFMLALALSLTEAFASTIEELVKCVEKLYTTECVVCTASFPFLRSFSWQENL